MTSQEKFEACRKNSKKSTGPKSESGKRRSSLNALKLGIYAKTYLLPSEDRQAYAELETEFRTSLNPEGPVGQMIVDEMVSIVWQRARLNKAEYAAIKKAQFSIVFEDLLRESEMYAHKHAMVNEALRDALAREERLQLFDGSETSAGRSEGDKELLKVVEQANALPVGYTILESHGRRRSNSAIAEIDRQRRVLRNDFLRLCREFAFSQERRTTFAVANLTAE